MLGPNGKNRTGLETGRDVLTLHQFPEHDLTSNRNFKRSSSWQAYGIATLIAALSTLIVGVMATRFSPVNLIMIYLGGVVIAAAYCGRGPSILTAVLSVLTFDFFFTAPFLTFTVYDSQYLITFAMILIVAVTISSMTAQIRRQADAAHEREWRTANLYSLSRELASSVGTETLIQIAAQHIKNIFDAQIIILLADANGQLVMKISATPTLPMNPHEQGVAQWVYANSQPAGLGTATLPGSQGLYLPLVTSRGAAGVLGVYPNQVAFSPEQFDMLDALTNQTALAIERSRLAEETERSRVQIETERLRNSLLSSVSHDLRTPLASITGAVSSLLENEYTLTPESRRELAQVAWEEATRLNRLVGNLLEITRLESGGVHVEKEWQPLEEVIGITLNRLEAQTNTHPITLNLPLDLPLVPIDGVLIEQVLVNLLENAVKYTPVGSPIDLLASFEDHEVKVTVADRGSGLAPGDETRIFDKFYRALPSLSGGAGLGLTISRGIIEAHGGRIWAQNRPSGGAMFGFTLPLEGDPPEVDLEND
ncbi:MAG: DUF4118 domain-containing protein [Chloroflexota bacterium]